MPDMTERRKVKEALEQLKIEQKDFAGRVDCDHTHLCHVLAGRRAASRKLARNIAAELAKHRIAIDAGALVMEEPISSAV